LPDYLLPGAIKIDDLQTPVAATQYAMRGMGEGGAVAPLPATANAVRDAISVLGAPGGAEVTETPITAPRILAVIRKARAAALRS
jgi:aerobic carbon-monoxide dehydrogenase large subunit